MFKEQGAGSAHAAAGRSELASRGFVRGDEDELGTHFAGDKCGD